MATARKHTPDYTVLDMCSRRAQYIAGAYTVYSACTHLHATAPQRVASR